jgi:hypothetical protein
MNEATTSNPIAVEGHDKPTFQVRLELKRQSRPAIFPKQSLLAAVIEAGQWWSPEEGPRRVVLRVPHASVAAAEKWAAEYAAKGRKPTQAAARKKLEMRRKNAR